MRRSVFKTIDNKMIPVDQTEIQPDILTELCEFSFGHAVVEWRNHGKRPEFLFARAI